MITILVVYNKHTIDKVKDFVDRIKELAMNYRLSFSGSRKVPKFLFTNHATIGGGISSTRYLFVSIDKDNFRDFADRVQGFKLDGVIYQCDEDDLSLVQLLTIQSRIRT